MDGPLYSSLNFDFFEEDLELRESVLAAEGRENVSGLGGGIVVVETGHVGGVLGCRGSGFSRLS